MFSASASTSMFVDLMLRLQQCLLLQLHRCQFYTVYSFAAASDAAVTPAAVQSRAHVDDAH